MVWRVWILFHNRAALICLPPVRSPLHPFSRTWTLADHYIQIITLVGSTGKLDSRQRSNSFLTRTIYSACGIVMVHKIWHGASEEFVRHMAVSAWTLGMATQAYSTSFIAWEVWRRGVVTTTSFSRSRTSYYKAIIIMIVESGALYTAIVLPLTVTFAIGSTVAIILAGLLEPMAVSLGHF